MRLFRRFSNTVNSVLSYPLLSKQLAKDTMPINITRTRITMNKCELVGFWACGIPVMAKAAITIPMIWKKKKSLFAMYLKNFFFPKLLTQNKTTSNCVEDFMFFELISYCITSYSENRIKHYNPIRKNKSSKNLKNVQVKLYQRFLVFMSSFVNGSKIMLEYVNCYVKNHQWLFLLSPNLI